MIMDLRERTKAFALEAILFTASIPYNRATDNTCKQFIRCATSVGANYRAAKRARSTPDFINKIKIAEEEADECIYWLDLLLPFEPGRSIEISKLAKEADELTAILVATLKTARLKQSMAFNNK